jgi:dephospho-CoA kinase
MKNVAFVGKMAAGKSYYASLLRQELIDKGINSNVVHISSKIKELAAELFGMKDKDRDLLQKIAGKMREIDEDVWIKYLVYHVKKEGKIPFIVDDVRFKDEVNMLKENFDLLVIKIDSDDVYRRSVYKSKYGKEPTEKELNDVTETSSDDIVPDLVLTNDYTIHSAKANMNRILEAIEI